TYKIIATTYEKGITGKYILLVTTTSAEAEGFGTLKDADTFMQKGAAYFAMGRYMDAEPLVHRSLKIREARLGKEHPDVAPGLHNLATLYQANGRYRDAEPLFQRCLRIRETKLGKDHPDVAPSLNNLAAFYANIGRYQDAEP